MKRIKSKNIQNHLYLENKMATRVRTRRKVKRVADTTNKMMNI